MLIECLIIIALIVFNGIFSMSEIAIVTSRKARLQQMANEGNANAQAALDLANEPGNFLSTVQIGITLVGILSGVFGGATVAESIAPYISMVPALAPYSYAIAIAVVVVVITFLTIIIGELVPKRIALSNAERIATYVSSPMRLLSILTMPVVRVFNFSTELVLRILGVKPSSEPPVTEEEIKVLIDQGAKAGIFEEAESDMVESVFHLGDRRVSSMMVPRTDMVILFTDDTTEALLEKILKSGHSSFPVCENEMDNVLGVVFAKDLLVRCMAGQPIDLKAAKKEALFIPESMPALKALELFKKSGKHTALIIDEYGGLQGLITIHDIMESVVGDISQADSPKVVRRDDGSWLVDGMLPVEEYKKALEIDSLPEEESGAYQTVGGFVLANLHRIPAVGNKFASDGYTYEVVDMDGLRVDKIMVTHELAKAKEEAGE